MTNSEFVVTEHHAKRAGLHWDLRFQIPKSDMWASFAVRKGVPLNPGTKVLAVRTHDHKRDEALLTGEIESGYGAGKFKEWDRGKCTIHKYGISHIAIEFKGKKVKGIYHLINMGVTNKKFDEQQYWLFKGKSINETSGMAGRVPTAGISVDLEDGQSEETCKTLPWSISEGVQVMKDYAMVATYTAMKGFFKKRPAGEYLLLGLKDVKNNTFLLIQFFDMLKPDMYICAIVGGAQSPDDEVLEGHFDQLRYATDIKILEDKVPITFKFGSGVKITFTKPSKYVGKTVELLQDSRLPSGYYIARCKMKPGFEPAQQFKVGPQAAGTTPLKLDAFDNNNLNDIKKMRAFTTSRMDSILKTKK